MFGCIACYFSESAGSSLASRLRSRSVFRFAGPDIVKFLRGLLTNDVRGFSPPPVEKPSPSSAVAQNTPAVITSPVYAALLTPQGRFLFDLFLYERPQGFERLDQSGSGPGPGPEDEEIEVFADVDSRFLEEIVQTFKRFRLRSKVDIESVAEEFSCWQRYGSNVSQNPSLLEEPEAASVRWGAGTDQSAMLASQTINGWQWLRDPRLDCLEFRGIFPAGTSPPLVEVDKETDEENYLWWRIEKGVAEGSSEIPKGQELIARTHHRGVIRKRLLPLKFLNDQGRDAEHGVPPGSDVVDATSGKKIGTVSVALGCCGLGLLRLEEAQSRSALLTISGQEGVKVEGRKPDWWPQGWQVQEAGESRAVA
ncbi:hypothetical protein MLD38_038476 [Melastoma candidum]|uniref:Uncharacterized protein n=1 Tax=Melastoma candidum TaxID=119954 RepID=A0ACB9L084_9MYRT|nr:hypothetical protein MLD38_038476 [Melastoma candidum]